MHVLVPVAVGDVHRSAAGKKLQRLVTHHFPGRHCEIKAQVFHIALEFFYLQQRFVQLRVQPVQLVKVVLATEQFADEEWRERDVNLRQRREPQTAMKESASRHSNCAREKRARNQQKRGNETPRSDVLARRARRNLNSFKHCLSQHRSHELEQLGVVRYHVRAVGVGVQLRRGIPQKETQICIECALHKGGQELFEHAASVNTRLRQP